MEFRIKSIGSVSNERTEVKDDYWGGVLSTITLNKNQFTSDVTKGLDGFSHLEVVYYFHRVNPERIETTARRPRNNPNWPEVGIFAQRAKGRPNLLGVSCCRLINVDGLTLTVEGLDAIHGTPVIDIKPYMNEFGPRGVVTQPQWSEELMKDYYSEK